MPRNRREKNGETCRTIRWSGHAHADEHPASHRFRRSFNENATQPFILCMSRVIDFPHLMQLVDVFIGDTSSSFRSPCRPIATTFDRATFSNGTDPWQAIVSAKSMNRLGNARLFARCAFDVAGVGDASVLAHGECDLAFLRTTTFDPTPHSTAPRPANTSVLREQSTCRLATAQTFRRPMNWSVLQTWPLTPPTKRRRTNIKNCSSSFSNVFPQIEFIEVGAKSWIMVAPMIHKHLGPFRRPHVCFFNQRS